MRTVAAIIAFDFLGFQFRARKTMWRKGEKRIFTHGFMPAASPKALTRISREIRSWSLHRRSDLSLNELAAQHNPCIRGWIAYYSHFYRTQLRRTEEDRCLCHSMGSSQVQADGAADQGSEGLVRPAAPREPEALRPLATMSWQRPGIGSRVTREGHARL